MEGAVLLIAVDRQADRDLFRRALASSAHHLVFSQDGQDALDRFFEVKPHIFIAHAQLDKMDGAQLFRAIRNAPQAMGVKRVLLGVSEDPSGQSDRALPLPIEADELQRLVAECMLQTEGVVSTPPASSNPSLEEPALPRAAAPALDEELPISSTLTQEVDLVPTTDARIPGPSPEPPAVARGVDESQLGKRLSRRVRETFERIDSMDHYALLNVPAGADAETISAAFFELSIEFHPDRFFLLKGGDLKEKIYRIYRQLLSAYTVLCDPTERQAYDAQRTDSVDVDVEGASADIVWEEATQAGQTQVGQTQLGTGAGGLVQVGVALKSDDAHRMLSYAADAERADDLEFARMWLHLARHYEPGHEVLDEMISRVETSIFGLDRADTR